MITIRGGEVLTENGWAKTDVTISEGRVTVVGSDVEDGVVVDATGCWVGPGFVDMHTHLREPGQTWKEDISSGSAAAAAGGFTAITAMPNTYPAIDSPELVESVRDRASATDLTEVVVAASVTARRSGEQLGDLEGLYRTGVRLFTDDGDPVAPRLVGEALGRLAGLPGAILAQHAEDPSQSAGGHMHEGTVSRRLGVAGLPASAESDVVRSDLEEVERTGGHYHCQHVSAKMTVELIRDAKNAGLPVTAEVTPHHLILDDRHLAGLDPDYKMYPPLRTPQDREALVAAVRDGTIDVVATDHAPHTPNEKDVAFEDAPRGVIGLETAASATWQALGDRDLVFSTLSRRPAELLGLNDQGRFLVEGASGEHRCVRPVCDLAPQPIHFPIRQQPFPGSRTGRADPSHHLPGPAHPSPPGGGGMMRERAQLVTADGEVFNGYSVGSQGSSPEKRSSTLR
jgi:dihydroorotase